MQKRNLTKENQWKNVEEEIPTAEEVNIIISYSNSKIAETNLTTLDKLTKELGLNE